MCRWLITGLVYRTVLSKGFSLKVQSLQPLPDMHFCYESKPVGGGLSVY
jgi:hypothetical protein